MDGAPVRREKLAASTLGNPDVSGVAEALGVAVSRIRGIPTIKYRDE